MNARMFDEMVIEAQVWFQDLMEDFMEAWAGDRMMPEEEQDGAAEEIEEDLYSQEE